MTHSPVLRAHRAAVAAAEARAQATGLAAPASLTLEAEEIPRVMDLGAAGSIRLELNRSLWTGAHSRARRSMADMNVDRARIELAAAERRLQAQIGHSLVQTAGARRIASRLGSTDSLLALAEEGLRARFAVGGARYVDVLRLRTERLRTQSDHAQAVVEAHGGYRRLLAFGGSDDEAGPIAASIDSVLADVMRTPGDPPPPPPIDSLVAWAAGEQRADWARARAEAARRLTYAEQRPSIDASVGVQRFSAGSGQENSHIFGPTIGLSMSLPFTASGANRLARHAADLEGTALDSSRAAVRLAIRTGLTAAWERYQMIRTRLSLYDRALLHGAREERESALAAYQNSEIPLIELLDFERALTQTEMAIIRLRIEAASVYAELFTNDTDNDRDFSFGLPEAP